MDNKDHILIAKDNKENIEYIQCEDLNEKIEWYPVDKLKEYNIKYYTLEEASKFCKEANVSINSIINGLKYYTVIGDKNE